MMTQPQGPMQQAPQKGLMAMSGLNDMQPMQGPLGGQQPPPISMHPLILALLQHLQTQQPGTPQQQMQGPQGMMGGPAGHPYGAYGAFYGSRMPMNTGLQAQGLGSH